MVDLGFLRSAEGAGDCHPSYAEAMKEAADEIETMRAAIETIKSYARDIQSNGHDLHGSDAEYMLSIVTSADR